MNQDELKEVLQKHWLWLRQEEGGERASLGGSDLRGADLSESDLSRSNLRDADLRGSNFRWSDLSESDLSDADLSGADLSDADLNRSDLRGAIGDGKRIRTLIGMKYHINIWDDMMAIGCQQHRIEDWFEFSEDRIARMDSRALEWWSAKKDLIRQLAIEFGAIK